MATDRIERQVERLLNEAEAAIVSRDWGRVREAATSALILDPDNKSAQALLDAGKRGAGDAGPPLDAGPRRVLLSPARILIFSVLSAGLYIFYWSYLTWKQLKSETREDHYPIWHALTLVVPIYGLFRMYRHLEVVNDLAIRAGASSLAPTAGVCLLIAGNLLSWIGSLAGTDVTAGLALGAASTICYALIMVAAQPGLNKAWLQKDGGSRDAGLSWAEFALVLVGLLVWLGTLSPA
jgi:hypothetical protein